MKNTDIDILPELSEKDFYPPQDNRVWYSEICDENNYDEFNDYIKYYFDMCDEEEIYD